MPFRLYKLTLLSRDFTDSGYQLMVPFHMYKYVQSSRFQMSCIVLKHRRPLKKNPDKNVTNVGLHCFSSPVCHPNQCRISSQRNCSLLKLNCTSFGTQIGCDKPYYIKFPRNVTNECRQVFKHLVNFMCTFNRNNCLL